MSPRTAVKETKEKKEKREKRISRLRKPEEMSLEDWQIALRRQFGREQQFQVKNLGKDPIFSEFAVTNPQTRRTYRVAIRGCALGENFCSCPDFVVNTLGTCKHIEFLLARLEKRRGAKVALALGSQPKHSEIYLQYGAKREVVFRPGTECPDTVKRLAREYFDEHLRLRSEAFGGFHLFFKQAQAGQHQVRCFDDALAYIAQVRDRQSLADKIDRAFPKGIHSAALKDVVKVKLFPYQREGVLFAARAGRCLLADDMGLGKTVQAIAAAEILARYAGIERVLVISPTSLKHQWKQEIERFTGRQALVIEGLLPERTRRYQAEAFFKIANYDVIHRDLDLIHAWRPELVILDEAQRIKNWKTRAATTVKRLNSEYAFVLTGTPLENRLEELHSIVEFVDRFRLGPMFRFLDKHQHVDQTGRVVGYRNLSKISETLQPILLRRTKQAVLKDLPERMEKRFFVAMTPEQMKHHEENREVVGQVVHKWRRFGFLTEKDQLRLQIALQNMRMSCNSTYLLDQKTDHGFKADEMLELLAEILEDGEAKVVVFSQWVRMHELVAQRLAKRRLGYVMFHGGVPGPQRKDLIHRFKEDPDCRLFLSTDAGGVGLNLQNASVVINLDQPWNPAVLEQRIGRVHRLGQHRPVRVIHFIAKETIEEGMLELLQFKRSMFSGVLDDGQDEVFMGGPRLARFMETVEKATTSMRQPAAPVEEPPRQAQERISRPAAAMQRAAAAAGAEPAAAPSAPQQDTWGQVVSTGLSLLEKLGRAFGTGPAQPGVPSAPVLPAELLARDESTGRSYLKLPLPEPDVLQKIIDVVSALTRPR